MRSRLSPLHLDRKRRIAVAAVASSDVCFRVRSLRAANLYAPNWLSRSSLTNRSRGPPYEHCTQIIARRVGPLPQALCAKMKINRTALILLILLSTSCSYMEEQRIISDSEKYLKIKFAETPKLLKTEEYGWAEEGGYREIFQLKQIDCAKVKGALKNSGITPDLTDFERMLATQNIKTGELKYSSSATQSGDFLVYALDSSSCVLYHWSHTE